MSSVVLLNTGVSDHSTEVSMPSVMHVIEMIVFDIRGRPIQPATRGNRWKWFTDRHIRLACMDNSVCPTGSGLIIRKFATLQALKHHLDHHLHFAPGQVVYISDRLRALRRAKEKFHFLTLAVPPAHARMYTDSSTTSLPNTASLARLISYLDWRFRPEPTTAERVPPKSSGR